jgi:hypothetical protein
MPQCCRSRIYAESKAPGTWASSASQSKAKNFYARSVLKSQGMKKVKLRVFWTCLRKDVYECGRNLHRSGKVHANSGTILHNGVELERSVPLARFTSSRPQRAGLWGPSDQQPPAYNYSTTHKRNTHRMRLNMVPADSFFVDRFLCTRGSCTTRNSSGRGRVRWAKRV